MDFSKEMHKPIGYDQRGSMVTPHDLLRDEKFRKKLASLYHYLANHLQIKETPKLVLTNDQNNAHNDFGLTGYYDDKQKLIRLFVTDRHDTDVLRSFAHEVIHHWQNENGTLHPNGQQAERGEHYAQNDQNMRKREMEAYLFGNILFRDWQDEQRYGPPQTPPVMPQPIKENLVIRNGARVKAGLAQLMQKFIEDGTIASYHRKLSSGDMDANDFINDFSSKLVSALNTLVQTINNRGNWENQPNMIK